MLKMTLLISLMALRNDNAYPGENDDYVRETNLLVNASVDPTIERSV